MNRSNPPSTDREATVPDHNEELMKRFLVGEATEQERDAIEDRFIGDPVFFEALSALEHDLLLSLAQGMLPERWATPLRAALHDSPDRQRHLDEVTQLVESLRRIPGTVPTSAPAPEPVTSVSWQLPAAAVVLLGIGLGAWWWAMQPVRDLGLAAVPAASIPVPTVIATFVLNGGLTRSQNGDDNAFRIPANAVQVRLTAMLEGATATAVDARMRAMTGAEVEVPAETTVRPTPQGLEVAWVVPAALMVPGDYLITYRARTASVVIGSRFVRILK